jgi:hypothetical protein
MVFDYRFGSVEVRLINFVPGQLIATYSTVALDSCYTSQRVSLSVVLRVACCHGGVAEGTLRGVVESHALAIAARG